MESTSAPIMTPEGPANKTTQTKIHQDEIQNQADRTVTTDMGVLHDSQDAGFVMSSAETVEKSASPSSCKAPVRSRRAMTAMTQAGNKGMTQEAR